MLHWAEQIKRLGKSLKIQPPKNKKIMSKSDIIKRILNNKKLHKKALAEFRKIDSLNTES